MPKAIIRTYGDEVLRKKTKYVKKFDKKLGQLIQFMFTIMYENDGIGLAAPQIGISKKVIVVDTQEPGEKYALINPKLTWKNEEMDTVKEGCLSIPGIEAEVYRPTQIKVKANHPETGEEFEIEASGMLARVIQHEVDHLNGILFVDHLRDSERSQFNRKLQEMAAA